jgi:hypothetical protein
MPIATIITLIINYYKFLNIFVYIKMPKIDIINQNSYLNNDVLDMNFDKNENSLLKDNLNLIKNKILENKKRNNIKKLFKIN